MSFSTPSQLYPLYHSSNHSHYAYSSYSGYGGAGTHNWVYSQNPPWPSYPNINGFNITWQTQKQEEIIPPLAIKYGTENLGEYAETTPKRLLNAKAADFIPSGRRESQEDIHYQEH